MLKLADENAQPFMRIVRHEHAAADLQSSVWGVHRVETAWDADLLAASVQLHAVEAGHAGTTDWRPPGQQQGLRAEPLAQLTASPGAHTCDQNTGVPCACALPDAAPRSLPP